LPIQLRVVSKNPPCIWQTSIAGQIFFDTLLFLDTRVEGVKDEWIVLANGRGLFREGESDAASLVRKSAAERK
jgi:hypothetical protein